MGILKKIYPIILSTLLTGCYEDIELDIETKPVLCLNSLFIAGEPAQITLTHSWVYTDTESESNHNVEDAKVSIFANDRAVNLDYIPKEGDRIKIVAESTIYGKAEAEVTVPERIAISSPKWDAEIIDCKRWESFDDVLYYVTLNIKAKLTLDDPGDIDNYYSFSFGSHSETVEIAPDETEYLKIAAISSYSFISNAEPIFSEHIDQLDGILGNEAYDFTFFTDRQFSGKSHTLSLHFNDVQIFMKNIESPEELDNFGLNITLNSISQSYYNWCNYQWNAELGIMGDLSAIGMSEQMWGYSNVSSGAGVVAAKAGDSYLINLKEILSEVILSYQD